MTRFIRRRSNLRSARVNRILSAALLFVILACGVGAPSSTAPLSVTSPTSNSLHGPQPFATILCKFVDVPAEPDPVAYFERLLGSAYPGLDHYWREVSYGAISLTGSIVTGWHDLPYPQSDYLTGTPNLPVPTAESPVDQTAGRRLRLGGRQGN